MANAYLHNADMVPTFRVGDTVTYRDRQERPQIGKIKRIEGHWDRANEPPYFVYTVEHPTYRGGRFYTTDERFV